MKLMKTDVKSNAVEGQELEIVMRFVYLSSAMSEDGGVRRKVRAGNSREPAAFNGKKIWNSTDIIRKTKLQLINAIFMAVLLYICKSWKGLCDIEVRLEGFKANVSDKKEHQVA